MPNCKAKTMIITNKKYRIIISLNEQDGRRKGKGKRQEKAWNINIEGSKMLKKR